MKSAAIHSDTEILELEVESEIAVLSVEELGMIGGGECVVNTL